MTSAAYNRMAKRVKLRLDALRYLTVDEDFTCRDYRTAKEIAKKVNAYVGYELLYADECRWFNEGRLPPR